MTEHMAERPNWDCLRCGKPGPCDTAREQMVSEMDPTQLRIFMWVTLEQAAEHLPDLPMSEAYDRFLAWT